MVSVHDKIPVRAPGDGWGKASIREKDGVVFDAIQGVVHLTQGKSVQLELEFHLTEATPRAYWAINLTKTFI